ncbi:hypothetical protein NY593_19715, partial [Enterobacter asburiae]|uniref:hypothetical protein n=1 Tax=Enterobacter asburiae TaxID=61645 RepID=UPI0022F09BB4
MSNSDNFENFEILDADDIPAIAREKGQSQAKASASQSLVSQARGGLKAHESSGLGTGKVGGRIGE